MHPKKLLKRLCSIDITLILLVFIIVLLTKPAQGYELDIYAMYPLIFWLVVLFVIIISVMIIVLSEYWRIKGHWQVALLSIIALYSIILLLPLFRGYYMFALGSYDVFAHFFHSQYILNTGHADTYYPGVHVLSVTLNHMANITLEETSFLIPTLFSVLYILFLSILGLSIQKGSKISLLPVLFAFPLLYSEYHRTLHPYIFILFTLPLYFYAATKISTRNKQLEFSIIAIILSFMVIIFHPLISLFLIMLLIISQIILYIFKKYELKRLNFSNIVRMTGILIIAFSAWYVLSFQSIQIMFKRVINRLFYGIGLSNQDIFDAQVSMIQSSGASVEHVIKIFILTYGSIFFYQILGLICILIVIVHLRRKNAYTIETLGCVLYIFGLVIATLFLTNDMILNEPVRAAGIAILMSMIFIPVVLYRVISEFSSKTAQKVVYASLSSAFVIIITLSLLTVFSSPIISSPSWHMTYMESEGLNWFFDNHENDIPALLMSQTYYNKYEMYHSGKNEQTNSMKTSTQYERLIPNHFGYDTYTKLGESLGFGKYYYISTELNRQHHLPLPQERRELFKKVTSTDFERLKQDNSINLLYSNGEFESWITVSINLA